ncbi:hypothetical protein NL676_009472 [Syzygium grande]|nr:hypothetical protein NL676_009472 [Syzygium grande]
MTTAHTPNPRTWMFASITCAPGRGGEGKRSPPPSAAGIARIPRTPASARRTIGSSSSGLHTRPLGLRSTGLMLGEHPKSA